jgi:hypothetical protein
MSIPLPDQELDGQALYEIYQRSFPFPSPFPVKWTDLSDISRDGWHAFAKGVLGFLECEHF